MANGQASGQQTKYQKRLRTSLVLDIVLDWVGDEILDLEEDLHKEAAHISWRRGEPCITDTETTRESATMQEQTLACRCRHK